MTFSEQLRLSRRCGAALLAVGLGLFGGLMLLSDLSSPDRRLLPLGYVSGAAIAGGFVLLGFGGVMRPAHRWLYLQSRENLLIYPRVTMRDRFTRYFDAPFWKWWLHIDSAGNDRDA